MSEQLDKIQKLKLAQTVLLGAYFGAIALLLISPDYSTIAFEKAYDDLSYEDYLVVLDFYDNWDRYTDSNAIIIDNIATGSSFVMLGSMILTSWYIYSLDTNDSQLKSEPCGSHQEN